VILIAVGCLVAVVVAVLVWPGEREPEYQGKKLSEWLRVPSRKPEAGAASERVEAIRHIGTNALPFLLKWIRCDVPPWKAKLQGILAKLPQRIRDSHALRSLTMNEAARRGMLAVIGFQILGRQSEPAIPELAKLANDPKSPEGSFWAISVLTSYQVKAIPELLGILGDRKAPKRMAVIDYFRYGALGDLGTNAHATVEILLGCLKEPDWRVRSAAARTLGNLALQPEVVIAALAESAQDREWMVRARSVEALAKFGEQARPVTAMLCRALNDSDSQVRMEATNTLHKVAPEVLQTNAVSGR
jgi:hypothetical protein